MAEVIWDGIEIREVSSDEAKRLVAEDKAEIMIGNDLKHRHQFTGYVTREMRAEAPVPAVETQPKEINWRDYKREAAKALGKPFNKTTKKDVEGYLECRGI